MAEFVFTGRTRDQDIDGLLAGTHWGVFNLTFGFPATASSYGSGYGQGEPHDRFEALNGVQMAAARHVLELISSVTRLNFTEVTDASATLRLAMSGAPASAWTYTPNSFQESGDTWFNNSTDLYATPILGNYAFFAFLHEIGHAVGLKHGNELGSFGAMTTRHDAMEYSVMSYRSFVGADGLHLQNEAAGYAQSFMMYDIAALQHMYGANFTTNNGNTTYRWDPATGETFINGEGQGSPSGNRVFMTIWDGGGTDTYDFSNYSAGLTLSLIPGAWSLASEDQRASLGDGHHARGNVYNSLQHGNDSRSLIENAIGGAGQDAIVGNHANNALWGGGGNDTVSGGVGDDVIYGNLEADTLFGNQQNDVLYGGRQNDALYGGQGDDLIYGNLDFDLLAGNKGSDTLYGGQADDHLNGGPGNDVLVGGRGADLFVISQGQDVILDFSSSDGDRLDLLGQPYSLAETENGSISLLLPDDSRLVLEGVSPTHFSDMILV
ncbi:M10 family metallopeptidase C-terminal domain-containing protein [Microvirga sp. GCM10011540]|uniref:M10 family metallopeptidase C-terminal domain-containing protein n=1 Tax=Microvirga sp. GCM10011540 TaxID=3317338 RepID=UPI003613B8AA